MNAQEGTELFKAVADQVMPLGDKAAEQSETPYGSGYRDGIAIALTFLMIEIHDRSLKAVQR